MIIKFKKTIWKTGSGSFIITIPKDLIDTQILKESKEYEFSVEVNE